MKQKKQTKTTNDKVNPRKQFRLERKKLRKQRKEMRRE